MPKLDVTRAARIKGPATEILAMKGPGFVWTRPAPAFVRDTFSGRADASNLLAHSGEIGATWTRHPVAPSTNLLMAADGAVFPGSASAVALYLASAVAPAVNALVSLDVVAKTVPVGSESLAIGVLGRANATAATFYMARINYGGSGPYAVQLFRSVNGTLTQLGSSITTTWAAGQTRRIGLRMIGTQIAALLDDTVLITVTDTNIATAGRVGLRTFSATAYTPTTGWQATRLEAVAL